MPVLILIYISAAFDLWLYTYFLNAVFERRSVQKWKNALILLGATILLILINSRQNFYLNFVGGLTLFFFTAFFLFKGKIKMLLFYEMLYYVVVSLMEAIGSYLKISNAGEWSDLGQDYSFMEPIYIIMTKMLTYLVILLIIGLVRKKKMGIRDYSFKKIFFLPFASLILMVGIQQSYQGENTMMIVGTILLLFANVFTFYCIEELVKAQEKNKEYELLNSQNEMKEIYYEKMEEISSEHRKYVHNLKDYLQTIGGLTAQGKSEEIMGLLKEMETKIESIRETRYTGNSILNALLCEKESIAKKQNITVQIEPAPYITFSFAKNRDLIVMAGNLLDNAIEAASQCTGSRKIHMSFSKEQGNFETMQIDNTYTGVLKKDGEAFISIKADKENHGLGIKSVEETAQKYGGVLLLEPKDNIFTAMLTLSTVYYRDEGNR